MRSESRGQKVGGKEGLEMREKAQTKEQRRKTLGQVLAECKAESRQKPSTLPRLQDAIKREPESYVEEFEAHYLNWKAAANVFEKEPRKPCHEFVQLTAFLAHTSHFYGKNEEFAEALMDLVARYSSAARGITIKALLQNLLLMDKRGFIAKEVLYAFLLRILATAEADLANAVLNYLSTSLGSKAMKPERKKWQQTIFGLFLSQKNVSGLPKSSSASAQEGGRGSDGNLSSTGAVVQEGACGRRVMQLLITLFVNNVWRDRETANMVAEGLFFRCHRIAEMAARFVLGDLKRLHIRAKQVLGSAVEKSEDELRADQSKLVNDIAQELVKARGSCKTNVRARNAHGKAKGKGGKTGKKMEQMKELAERQMAKLDGDVEDKELMTFHVMEALFDPHTICEQAFRKAIGVKAGSSASASPSHDSSQSGSTSDNFNTLNNSSSTSNSRGKIPFKLKLLLLTVSGRLMGRFQIVIPGFFRAVVNYARPSQDQVTRILAVMAQAVHGNVDVEELQSIVRVIADNFVSDAFPNPVIAIGINTLNEMAKRNTAALTPELLSDILVFMKTSKDKSVLVAASSLRNTYREHNPSMLHQSLIGRKAALNKKLTGDAANAHVSAMNASSGGIEGLELLLKLKAVAEATKRRKKGVDGAASLQDEEIAQELHKMTTTRILRKRDFEALKKLKIKLATAQEQGIDLIQWMNSEPKAWETMARDVLGDRSVCTRGDADECARPEDMADDSDGSDEQSNSEDDDVEEGSDADDGEEEGSDWLKNAEAADSETELAETTDSEDDEEGENGKSESESDGEGSLMSDLEGSSEESENENLQVLTGESLVGRKRVTRSDTKRKHRENREEKRKELKGRRHGGGEGSRAGCTNKSMARNKPMAMIRQKTSVRGKKTRDHRQKLESMKKHIKTLKTSIKQKLRPR